MRMTRLSCCDSRGTLHKAHFSRTTVHPRKWIRSLASDHSALTPTAWRVAPWPTPHPKRIRNLVLTFEPFQTRPRITSNSSSTVIGSQMHLFMT